MSRYGCIIEVHEHNKINAPDALRTRRGTCITRSDLMTQPYSNRLARCCDNHPDHLAAKRNRSRTRPRGSLEERFWQKVIKTDCCWLWTAGTMPLGYGCIYPGAPATTWDYAHRISWELHFGPIPEGLEVCHNCPGGDNPACVNPAHLWVGTHAQNMHDRDAKGRGRFGPKETRPISKREQAQLAKIARGGLRSDAKLTPTQVAEIRSLYDGSRGKQTELADRFGVDRGLINRVVNFKAYTRVAS